METRDHKAVTCALNQLSSHSWWTRKKYYSVKSLFEWWLTGKGLGRYKHHPQPGALCYLGPSLLGWFFFFNWQRKKRQFERFLCPRHREKIFGGKEEAIKSSWCEESCRRIGRAWLLALGAGCLLNLYIKKCWSCSQDATSCCWYRVLTLYADSFLDSDPVWSYHFCPWGFAR